MNKQEIGRLDEILYWAGLELERMSELIPCEDGSGKFVSLGGCNGVLSRISRAIENKEYCDKLLNPQKASEE